MKEVILENKSLKLGILPENGGSVSFLKYLKNDRYVDILRPMTDKTLDANSAALFLMVPYCSRIRGGSFVYFGITRKVPKNQAGIPDPIHGDAWKSAFDVVEASSSRVVLKMSHNKDKGGFPFSYDLEVTYELTTENTLKIKLDLKNVNALPMPCGMGVHPFFVKTKDIELDFNTQTVWSNWSDPIYDKPYVTPEAWRFSGGRPLKNAVFDTCFGGFDGTAKINYPDLGVFVTLTAKENFKHVVLYAPKGKSFVCLEPCTNTANAFNLAADGVIGTGIQSIGPAQNMVSEIVFEIKG